MKIWIIDHYSVPERYYPLIRQTIFARKLIGMGNQVRIISASTVHNSGLNLINNSRKFKEEYSDGVLYTYIYCHSYRGNGIKRVMNMIEFARKLPYVCNKLAEKEGYPDVIISCSMTLQACKKGIQIAKRNGIKVVAQITDLWPETLISYGIAKNNNPIVTYLRHVEKWIYKHANSIIFSMEGAYDYICEQGWKDEIPFEKVDYINNGVDLADFDFKKNNFIIYDEDLENDEIFKVVYTGSIRKVNNLGKLLDVAKHIQNKKIKMLIWGDGDERELLQKRIEQEKISNIIFKGKVDKKNIPYIVSRSDLNIAHNNSTDIFRFGISFNKIFDYFAAGKPIITDFACKYNPVIMMKAGVDVPSGSTMDIADEIEKIASLSENDYRAMCSQARKAAYAYDFNNLTKKLLHIINEL